MELSEILDTKKLLKPNIRKGDYITLGEMLLIDKDAARKRYERNKEDAVIAMKGLIKDRLESVAAYYIEQSNTISGLNSFDKSNEAIIDTVVTRSGRIAVVIKLVDNHFFTVYKTESDFNKYAHEFVELVLKDNPQITTIISDFNKNYPSSILSSISNLKVERVDSHRGAFNIAGILQKIASKY